MTEDEVQTKFAIHIDGKPLVEKDDLKCLGGSEFAAFNNALVQQVLSSVWTKGYSEADTTNIKLAAAGALQGMAPSSEIEGMLAAQMIATHNAAMDCYRRAMIPDQTLAGREMALTQANKLIRSYATLVQTLDKHRGKGQQKVTVEHVHVYQGGQAIVGPVTQSAPQLPTEGSGVWETPRLNGPPAQLEAQQQPVYASR